MIDGLDKDIAGKLLAAAEEAGVPVKGGQIRRSSSRFCLGVEHGDYNGTELFGVGTDRFIWMAYSPTSSPKMRLLSLNYPGVGVVEFDLRETPPPRSPEFADSWARFPLGIAHILRREGFELKRGLNAVLYGNIPGGGMSRSASLTLNLMLSLLDVNGLAVEDGFRIVDMAQAVETDYIGSPCGQLDQIMILFAREGLGTYYRPQSRTVEYVPLGEGPEFRLVSLDTGTKRPGLEKSTYKVRRAECETLVELLRPGYGVNALAEVRDAETYERIMREFGGDHPDLCARLRYIYSAQQRFYAMLEAWKEGDIVTVGGIFREDGIGLRDDYRISGPELEAMCDIARTIPGVYGERMLGGGDKGASGAIVAAGSVDDLARAVDSDYPARFPDFTEKYAVHTLSLVDGIRVWDGML
jgi:galactokinase